MEESLNKRIGHPLRGFGLKKRSLTDALRGDQAGGGPNDLSESLISPESRHKSSFRIYQAKEKNKTIFPPSFFYYGEYKT